MTETLAQRIQHLEGQLMRWPRSARVKRLLHEARAEETRLAESEASTLRGRIRRALGEAPVDLLRQIVRYLED